MSEKFEMRTKSGLDFYVVASAFQKAVRRCDVHKSLYWGSELYISGYDEYAWSRIIVIVSEDIGLANVHLPAQVFALYEIYSMLKKKKNKHLPERLQFTHAVNLIARSPKSRIIDNQVGIYFDKRTEMQQPEIDEYVYDMHTLKGKMLKRGNDHFFEVAAFTNNNPSNLEQEETEVRELAKKLWKDKVKSEIEQKPLEQQELF